LFQYLGGILADIAQICRSVGSFRREHKYYVISGKVILILMNTIVRYKKSLEVGREFDRGPSKRLRKGMFIERYFPR